MAASGLAYNTTNLLLIIELLNPWCKLLVDHSQPVPELEKTFFFMNILSNAIDLVLVTLCVDHDVRLIQNEDVQLLQIDYLVANAPIDSCTRRTNNYVRLKRGTTFYKRNTFFRPCPKKKYLLYTTI